MRVFSLFELFLTVFALYAILELEGDMRVIVSSLCLLTSFILAAQATIIHIPGDYPTIQAGINASVNGDTVLVASGTYSGEGNRNLNYGGRIIVVKSELGPLHTLIDCQRSGRGLYLHNGETGAALFSGFTIFGGYSSF